MTHEIHKISAEAMEALNSLKYGGQDGYVFAHKYGSTIFNQLADAKLIEVDRSFYVRQRFCETSEFENAIVKS